MLKYSLYIIKNNTAKKKLIHNWWKWSLQRLMTRSKIDDIIFRGEAHTQEDFKQRILNLTGSEPHSHASAINIARWSS